MTTKVDGKHIHTAHYFTFQANQLHVKKGIIRSFSIRASTICQEQQDLVKEIDNLRCDLQLNVYP